MKYFTPELIERFGSADPAAADAAEAAWEEAGERYRAYLRSVRAQLPAGLRQLLDSYYLHDAVVFGMGRRDGRFVVVLQLDTPPRDLLICTYDLAADAEIIREVLPTAHRCAAQVEWMYDEVEVLGGEPATFVHSILFSNGWEVRLRLRDIQVQQAEPVSILPNALTPAAPE